jgi:hypothetical protein
MTVAIDVHFLLEHSVCHSKTYFQFRSLKQNLISDYFDNEQYGAKCSLRQYILIFVLLRICHCFFIASMAMRTEIAE